MRARAPLRSPALLLSAAVHALALGALALRALPGPGLRPTERIVYFQLEPRPLLAGEPLRSPRQPPSAPAAPSAFGGAPRTDFRSDPTEREAETPQPPVPRLAAPVETGAVAIPDPWKVQPPTAGGRIGSGLRAGLPGCAAGARLTPAQQAVCDERFGERAARAAPISGSGDAERDSRFAAEGARALARYEARRRPLSGGVGVVGPGDCPGSNLGIGCAGAHLPSEMRQGASTTHNGAQTSEPRGFSIRLGGLEVGGERD